MTALLKFLDALFAESPGKGRGRNASRVTLLGLCAVICYDVRALKDQNVKLACRMVRIEAKLGMPAVTESSARAPAASHTDPNPDTLAATPPPQISDVCKP